MEEIIKTYPIRKSYPRYPRKIKKKRSKGYIITYDRKLLPDGMGLEHAMSHVKKTGIILYDSTKGDVKNQIRVLHLGGRKNKKCLKYNLKCVITGKQIKLGHQ